MAEKTTKQEFLARVSNALGRPPGSCPPEGNIPQPPAIDDALVRLASPNDDLACLFAQKADEVGMKVYPCTLDKLIKTVLDILQAIDAKSVVTAISNLPQGQLLTEEMSRAGVTFGNWRGDRSMKCQYPADAGITDVQGAIAETGSIICCTDADHSRGLSLVPPIHIAIVKKSDIIPDLLDFTSSENIDPTTPQPSSMAIITGPSKTADIEGILITGVHGPEDVYIVLVDDA